MFRIRQVKLPTDLVYSLTTYNVYGVIVMMYVTNMYV